MAIESSKVAVLGPEICRGTSEMRDPARTEGIYKMILILLIGLATISGARKDVNEFLSLAGDIQGFADRWLGDVLPTVQAGALPTIEICSNSVPAKTQSSTADFQWTGRVEAGKAIEIKGISGSINAEPASGSEVEVVAKKTAHRSNPDDVKIAFVEHPGGVTICALYPSDDSGRTVTCEPGSARNSSNVRNNDVRVDFTVRVPTGVNFTGRTVNGDIRAASLSGNVSSRTINGSIRITTSGYADAKTVNGEIVVSMGKSDWPSSIEFNTVNGSITLDLPSNLNTRFSADTLNGEISSDFPLSMEGAISRKHVSGTIGAGGRELLLKTLNGSINLRRAG